MRNKEKTDKLGKKWKEKKQLKNNGEEEPGEEKKQKEKGQEEEEKKMKNGKQRGNQKKGEKVERQREKRQIERRRGRLKGVWEGGERERGVKFSICGTILMQIPADYDHQSSNLYFNGFSERVEAQSPEIITADPSLANTPAPRDSQSPGGSCDHPGQMEGRWVGRVGE